MRTLLSLAVLTTATLFIPARSSASDAKPISRDIDLVLCLDVSNSMDGLIDSAKLKLWDIVNELARMQPTPNLRVSLYSYGHTSYPQASGWVRRELDLSTDLDAVYASLNGLTTGGGTELVARVCQAALVEQKWSTAENASRIIFICGNEPANQDQQLSLGEVAGLARRKNVIVNTIYCGSASQRDAKGWLEFATEAGGQGVCIDQNRGRNIALQITTPFDKEIGQLSGKLNTTYLALNNELARKAAANQVAQDQAAAGAAPSAAAERGAAKASGLYRNSSWDLVDKLKNDPKFSLKDLPESELPEELQKLAPEERLPFLKKKAEERAEIQKQIQELSNKRQQHIEAERKKLSKAGGEQGLDEALKSIIRNQVSKTPAPEVNKK